jgi:hypothetical protein
MANRTIRTFKKRAKFLEALRSTCNVSKSRELSRIGKSALYDWRKDDADFRREWDEALDVGADVLEDEAKRRAVQGVREPVFQGGKLVGEIQKYSDTLLIFLLKGAKPEKYNDRAQLALTGSDGGPVQFALKSILDEAPAAAEKPCLPAPEIDITNRIT